MKNCLARTVFGYSVTLNYGEGFFRWSEYYLIPMMEVKARKKRKLSAEPVGKTHRCISRYIRALGEKHETSTAFNSIHTSVAPSLSLSFSLLLQSLPSLLKIQIYQKLSKLGRCQWRSRWKCAKDAFVRIFSSVSKCEGMKTRRWRGRRGSKRRGEILGNGKSANIPSRVAGG